MLMPNYSIEPMTAPEKQIQQPSDKPSATPQIDFERLQLEYGAFNDRKRDLPQELTNPEVFSQFRMWQMKTLHKRLRDGGYIK